MRAIIGPLAVFALLPLASLGCRADRDDWITEPLEVLGPAALGHQLYYVERNRGELLVVDVLAGSPGDHVTRLALGEDPGAPRVVPGPDRLSAPRALAVLVPRERELHLVAEDDEGGPTLRTLILEQAYDRLALSPDGAWGMAWMGSAEAQADFISLPGKVAVIDVEGALAAAPEDASDAVSERPLHLEEAPGRVVFSAPMRLFPGEDPVTLAAVVTDTRIAVVNLAEPLRRSRTIFLDRDVWPRRLRFSDGLAPEAAAEYLLFDSEGEAGISAYRITGTEPASEEEPRLQLTYHQLLPHDRPADFEVFAAPTGDRYVLVSVGANAARATVMWSLTNPLGTEVELADQVFERVSRVLSVPGQDDVAVLYDDSGRGRVVHVLSLPADADARPKVRAGEPFAGAIGEVHPVRGQSGLALVFLAGAMQAELVDLAPSDSERERLSSEPLRMRRPLDMVWDRSGSNLWLAVSDPSLEDGELLVRARVVDKSLLAEPLKLDFAPRAVHLLEERGLVVVTHDAAHGLLTVVEIAELERGEAKVLEGFFFTGLLDAAAGRTP